MSTRFSRRCPRTVFALATAVSLCTGTAVIAAGPAQAAVAHSSSCPSKAYFLHKLQKINKGTTKVDSSQCVGQWAGVIAATRSNQYDSLFQHTSGSTWVYRPRNTKNCNAIPKKLDYICQGS